MQDVQEAEAHLAFLEGKLGETNIAGMKHVSYQRIESETRTVMLANAQSEYMFKIVDSVVVPLEKSGPKCVLIAAVITMLGGVLGVFTIFVIAFIRSGKESQQKE